MKTFRTIVCGYDFTPNSESALAEALRIAGEENGTVIACHVVSAGFIEDQQEFLNLPTDLILKKVKDAVVQRVAEVATDETLSPTVKVLIGRPEFALTDEARSVGAELLVLGAASDPSGKTGIIGRRCVLEASCPVLISRNHHGGQYRSIIAAVDLSETSRCLIEAAAKLAVDENAAIKAVHSHYPPWTHPTNVLYDLRPSHDEDFKAQYYELLQEQMAQLIRHSSQFLPVELETEIVENMNDVDAILRSVSDSDADLLAFGCHGPSGLKQRFLGTTAEHLLHGSHCSVLAIPASEC
ncbi:MAG: nucleotide-binding universal stress UspA family protein [Verrucomicrobiales bacterium]|jgi:nucleotide-binding universal stress UspA family protein